MSYFPEEDFDNYKCDYTELKTHNNISSKGVKKMVAHAKKRFYQRFAEEFEGSYPNAIIAFNNMLNEGISELDIYQLVDYYFGMKAKKPYQTFKYIREYHAPFILFRRKHVEDKSEDDDWYAYCQKYQNDDKSQSNLTLDEVFERIAL